MLQKKYSLILQTILMFSIANLLTVSAIWCKDSSAPKITIPLQEKGNAVFPLIHEFKDNERLYPQKALCRSSFTKEGVEFSFAIPRPKAYNPPKGTDMRDSQDIWKGNRVEIFLGKADSPDYFQYAVNFSGTVFDSKNSDANWNGTAQTNVEVKKDKGWIITIKVPFSDLGITYSPRMVLRGNVITVVCETNSFGVEDDTYDHYTRMWAPTFPGFHSPGDFGTIILDETAPFVENFKMVPITDQSFQAKMELRNPGQNAVQLMAGNNEVNIEAGKTGTFDQLLNAKKTGAEPAVISIGEIFSYTHQLVDKNSPVVDIEAMDFDSFKLNIVNMNVIKKKAAYAGVKLNGEKLYYGSLQKLGEEIFSIKDLPNGKHKLECFFLDKQKNTVYITDTEFTKITPHKVDFDFDEADFSKYFPPVTFAENHIKNAQSEIDLTDSILPKHIKIRDTELLQSPIQLTFNGEVLPVGGELQSLKKSKNRVVLASSNTWKGKTVTVIADHQYDGFVWYNVRIKSKRPFEYGKIELVMPLDLGPDALIASANHAKDSLITREESKVAGYSADRVSYAKYFEKKNEDFPLTAALSVGTDENENYRGLCFITEGPKGWNLKNYDRMLNLERKNSRLVVFTARISDGKTRIRQDEINFSFGLQPFPCRKYDENYHKRVRMDCSFGYNNDFFAVNERDGVTDEIVFESWTEYENYWKTDINDEKMKKYLLSAKKHNLGLVMYFGFLISDQIPEFNFYHDLVLSKPSKYPHGKGFQPYLYYKQGNPNQCSYNFCKSSFWSDELVCGIEGAIQKYSLTGVYLDGTFSPAACCNPKHGCEIIDYNGRKVFTYPVRATRRLAEKLFCTGQKYSKDFIIDAHLNAPLVPTMSLCTSYYTGEGTHLFEPKYALIEPNNLRAWMNGRLYGVPCEMLLRPPQHVNIGWGQALLTDTFIRFGYGGGGVRVKPTVKMWKVYDKYKLDKARFTPYFSSRNQIKSGNEKIKVSYYEAEKALVAIVSNYYNETEESVRLDFSTFKDIVENSKLKDEWSGQEFSLKDRKLDLTIPKLSFRLLIIEK